MKPAACCLMTLLLGLLITCAPYQNWVNAQTGEDVKSQYERLKDEIKKGVETKDLLEESAKKYVTLLQNPYSPENPSKVVNKVDTEEEPDEPTPTEVFIELPEEVEGSGLFIAIKAETNGKEVKWVSFDKGLDVFPSDLLRDTKTIVVGSRKDGVYRLGAYTALGDQPSDMAFTKVIVGSGEPDPPTDPKPPVDDLSKLIKSWLSTVPSSAIGESSNISTAMKGIATSPDKFETLDEMKSGFGAVLSQTVQNKSGWDSFFKSMVQYTDSLEKDGTIKTPSDFANTLNKIAEEL